MACWRAPCSARTRATTGTIPSRRTTGCAAVAELPGARRALALGQIGQSGLAEKEIRKLAARASPTSCRA